MTIENIPPAKLSLFQHVKKAVYQTGYVLSQALAPAPDLPSPELRGWTRTDSGGSYFGLTDQKLQSLAMSCCAVTARRDTNASANVTSQIFNAENYVAAERHLTTPDFN